MPPDSKQPTTLYRYGDRTHATVQAKNAYSRHYRRELANATFGPDARARLLEAVRSGTPLPQAAAAECITPAQVYGRARWDPDFRAGLEEALEEWSAPRRSAYCGTATGYRQRGCRCGECRAAHNEETGRYR